MLLILEIQDIWFLGEIYLKEKEYFCSFKEEKLIISHESVEQTKSFNFPYQIGHQGDAPELALDYYHEINHLDIVLVASDGLFDNVDSEEILQLLSNSVDKEKKIKDLKKTILDLGNLAYKYSLDK